MSPPDLPIPFGQGQAPGKEGGDAGPPPAFLAPWERAVQARTRNRRHAVSAFCSPTWSATASPW
ncbi:hypothetical protein CGLO_08699 [Colletotrichum gloeosporioides Cg-14]|uniref:Uncharacterized protein n=1 Tax=Colletotrichum gloeosporioides (strain Cg-14) TaxID=1237896 RepID=T0KHS9_COLGC|nr:hypothetical protein CGLO_08699 [Colletotrichum gloeosporioides Cg-14]